MARGTSDPLWYKDAILYELHVRAFFDSNADGIGDFAGLARKLDYLQDLGITAIWLLPFYPSPLKDDGYDTADYLSVHPSYGTLRDCKRVLRDAHARGPARRAARTRSGVSGMSRMRTPVAWKTAFAMAGAGPLMGISAMALAPNGPVGSCVGTRMETISGTSIALAIV